MHNPISKHWKDWAPTPEPPTLYKYVKDIYIVTPTASMKDVHWTILPLPPLPWNRPCSWLRQKEGGANFSSLNHNWKCHRHLGELNLERQMSSTVYTCIHEESGKLVDAGWNTSAKQWAMAVVEHLSEDVAASGRGPQDHPGVPLRSSKALSPHLSPRMPLISWLSSFACSIPCLCKDSFPDP